MNPGAQQDAVAKDSIVLNEASPEPATDFRTLDTVLSFAGLWVNETYIDKLRRTRSPRLSQEVTESCITIPERTLQLTRMIEAFHEGGSDLMVVKDRDSYKLYDSTEASVYENIEIISPSRIKIGNQYFRRLEHYDGTDHIVEELLLSGRYERENKHEVIFTAEGRVQGLDSFSRYIPFVDYTSGPLVAFDLMQMATGQDNQYDYGYRFNGDTLRIFNTTCADWDSEGKVCDSIAAGPMLYKLVRKKD